MILVVTAKEAISGLPTPYPLFDLLNLELGEVLVVVGTPPVTVVCLTAEAGTYPRKFSYLKKFRRIIQTLVLQSWRSRRHSFIKYFSLFYLVYAIYFPTSISKPLCVIYFYLKNNCVSRIGNYLIWPNPLGDDIIYTITWQECTVALIS